MAKTTENLGLKKPEQTDFYNVDDFNENMDKIDGLITYGTTALVDGTSTLQKGHIYLQIEE